MNNEKRYYVKRRFIALWLIFAVANLVYFIIWLVDVRQILTSDVMLCLLISFASFLAAFEFMRVSICTTDDSIIHRVGLWLAKEKELQYRDITKVYKFGLLPDSLYVVEGKAGNKSTRRHIPVFIDGWTDILRTVVSKVDAKIVDKKVLKMLGCEAPVAYLGCEAPVTCNGNSVSHEKSNLPLMLVTHLIRFVQNFVILTFGIALSVFISNFVIPNHPRIVVFTIYQLILIVTFFLIGYRTRVGRWIHLFTVATIFSIGTYKLAPIAIFWKITVPFFATVVIGGVLSSKYSKSKEAD